MTNEHEDDETTWVPSRRTPPLGAAVVLVLILGSLPGRTYAQAPKSTGPGGTALAESVARLRRQNHLVALSAMVMADGQVTAAAVDGERKSGSGVDAQLGDRWHIGSVTKPLTATMIARLVESGKMDWSETVGQRFPDTRVHEDWKPVTLRQLLTHTGGAPPNFPPGVQKKHPAEGRRRTAARRAEVLKLIAKPPAYAPGTQHTYSNVGYTIAGVMAEQATGRSWEDLMRLGVFEPLRLTSAGFGPPKSTDKPLEQPQGHLSRGGSKLAVGEEADNTPIMGPSGIVHMTLEDLCTFATEHLRGNRGKDRLLKAATYERLHTPERDNYACGWVERKPGASKRPTIFWHNGSNTMWYALVVFIPEKNMVVAVASNDGDMDKAEPAAWEIVLAQSAAAADPADRGPVDPKRLEGRYQLTPTFVFDVRYEDDRLLVGITNQATQEVFPDSPTEWSYRSVEAKLEFHLPAEGPAYALTLHQNGAAQRAKRLRTPEP